MYEPNAFLFAQLLTNEPKRGDRPGILTSAQRGTTLTLLTLGRMTAVRRPVSETFSGGVRVC